MTEFLLAGIRQPQPGGSGELALAAAARRVVQAAAWHGWMRRWGLLLSYGLPGEPRAGVRACLVVAASDELTAQRLAAGWATVSGYRVAVLALTGELAGESER
jgi:hypothetical protein